MHHRPERRKRRGFERRRETLAVVAGCNSVMAPLHPVASLRPWHFEERRFSFGVPSPGGAARPSWAMGAYIPLRNEATNFSK
jgi:hypothetical protein